MPQESILLDSGLVVADRYRLEQRLGDGNFGQVWQASDMRLERQHLGIKNFVAVKFLKEEYVNDPEVRADFSGEIRALYQLSHQNLLRLFDFDILPNMAYLVTEYASNGSLAHQLAKKGRFTVEETLQYLDQTAAGLDFAHAQKFVHRDLKPHNLLVNEKNRLVIADFGLSQISNLSSTRSMMQLAPCGTPAYMAPEQWDWLAGWRSDIYALGIIVYQMLTGRLPFRSKGANPREWKDLHQNTPTPSLQKFNSDLPLEYDRVIEKALAKNPKERHNSATEMANHFREVVEAVERQKKGSSEKNEAGQNSASHHQTGIITVPIENQASVQENLPKVVKPTDYGISLKVKGTTPKGIGQNSSSSKPKSGPSFLRQLGATRNQRITPQSKYNTFIPLGTEIRTLAGHQHYVNSLAFSPDNSLLASASLDKTIQLWDVESGKLVKILQKHQASVHSIAFSTNGEYLASASADKTILIWEVATGNCIQSINQHTGRVLSVEFSRDGLLLASASADNSIKLWNTQSWKLVKTLNGHTDFVTSVAFAPNSDGLVSGSKDGSIRLWELPGGTEVGVLTGHDGPVLSVAFAPDGKRIASGSLDKSIKLWSMETGSDFKTFRSIGGDYIYAVAFSPSGKMLASASNSIRLKDMGRLAEIENLSGHGSHLINCVAFSSDGRYLASGADDKLIKIWWAEQFDLAY